MIEFAVQLIVTVLMLAHVDLETEKKMYMFLTRGADVVMIVCCSVIDKYSAAASYQHVAISATS